jgi:ketosteroid isomerase-like protein
MTLSFDFRSVSSADRADITALCYEYAWRIDQGHAATVWELFTEDGALELPWGNVDGRTALRAAWAERSARPLRTRHLVTNVRLARVDDAEITGTAGLILFVRKHGEPMTAEVAAAGEHVDLYRRDASGRWLIHRRRFDTVFSNDPTLPPLPSA